MKALLDSHALLWYLLADPRLSASARSVILDADNAVLISAGTLWEIAIKVSIGKINLNQPYEKFVELCLVQAGFTLLPIEPGHTGRVSALPFPPKHRDPFDRLLAAQALVEDVPILSSDDAFDAYGVRRIW